MMPKIQKPLLHQPGRRYFGEAKASRLKKWLNDSHTNPKDKKKVERAIYGAARFPKLLTKALAADFVDSVFKMFPPIRLAPVAEGTRDETGGTRWCITYRPRRRYGVGFAFLEVAELLESGLLHRLRKCSCGQWFYQRFSHQKAHSPKCQQMQYRETHKTEWNDYMREYRNR